MNTPDDELPPWLGTAFQDAFRDIFANQHHAAQHAEPQAEQEHKPCQ